MACLSGHMLTACRQGLPSVFGQPLARLYFLWLINPYLSRGYPQPHRTLGVVSLCQTHFPRLNHSLPSEPLAVSLGTQSSSWCQPAVGVSSAGMVGQSSGGVQQPLSPSAVMAAWEEASGEGSNRGRASLARLADCPGRGWGRCPGSPWAPLFSVRALRWLPPPCATAPIPI